MTCVRRMATLELVQIGLSKEYDHANQTELPHTGIGGRGCRGSYRRGADGCSRSHSGAAGGDRPCRPGRSWRRRRSRRRGRRSRRRARRVGGGPPAAGGACGAGGGGGRRGGGGRGWGGGSTAA